MKKTSVFLTIMALAASAFAVEVGKPAPNFTATDINGNSLGAYKTAREAMAAILSIAKAMANGGSRRR